MCSSNESLDVTSHYSPKVLMKKSSQSSKKPSCRRIISLSQQPSEKASPPRKHQPKSRNKPKSPRDVMLPPMSSASTQRKRSITRPTLAECLRSVSLSQNDDEDEVIEVGPYRPQHHNQQPQQSIFNDDLSVSVMSTSSRVSFSERGLEEVATIPDYDQESRKKCFYSNRELEEFRFEWEMERDGLFPTQR